VAEAALKQQQSTDKLNLRQKLLAAMRDMEVVEQRGENKAQGYAYTKASDIILAARRALVQHGVIFTATEEEIIDGQESTTRSGAIMSSCRVRMRFSFLDTDSDERIDFISTGEGQDTGDKGVYKGKTGAIKYGLTQNLLIAAGDDAEDDTGEEDRTERQVRPVQLVKDRKCPKCGNVGSLMRNKSTGIWQCWKSKGGCEGAFSDAQLEAVPQGTVEPSDVQTPPPEEDSTRMSEKIVATDEMLAPLNELIEQSSDPSATLQAILSRCGVKSLKDMTPKQVDWQVSSLQRKLESRDSKRPRK
jgi:ribosomal protein L37AE/L43A